MSPSRGLGDVYKRQTLTGALTDIRFDFVDGVRGDTIPEKAFPPGEGHTFPAGQKGSWRAHINAIRKVVNEGYGSAMIFEDDVDWDVRIKEQLQYFAQASHALTQPLQGVSSKTQYADSSFPNVSDSASTSEGWTMGMLPLTQAPRVSPYGDNWDVLWLGHCGIRRPQNDMSANWADLAKNIPKGFVVHRDDLTVPERRYLDVFDNPGHSRFRADFPDHTRVIHHAMEGICSLAYAVSQRGARSLLYELGVKKYNDNFDIMLREYCDGTDGREKHVCLTVQPTFFDHHRPAGDPSKESDIVVHAGAVREKAVTKNIRFSTRLNIEKLLRGETDYDDQYPDTDP